MSWRIKNNSKHLVGYWPMNGHAEDLSNNENDGTWTAGVEGYVEMPNGLQAGDFPDDPYVNFGTGGGKLDVGTGDFSVSVWFKWNSTAINEWIFSSADAGAVGDPGFYIGVITLNTVRFQITDSSSNRDRADGSVVVDDGMWHHAVLVATQNDVIGYTDGEFDVSVARTAGNVDSGQDIVIGAQNDGGGDFNGEIGPVRFYNIGLTADEVLDIFQGRV